MSSLEIPKLILDPQNEQQLVQLAYDRIREASGGLINDFRPGSPLAALIEGQMFGIAELLYYLNMLPEALALETFRLLGVTRSAGTQATGYLIFLLTNNLSSDFIINPGYSVPFKDSAFVTQEQLVIPAGVTEGSVLVKAARAGSDLNVAEYGLVVTSGVLTYVQTIWNPQAITGGSDVEDLTTTVARAQQALRSRSVLVSQTDYELAAQEALGAGSRALCIPFLNSNKTQESAGQVHIFLVDSQGNPASLGSCASIRSQLQDRTMAASQVWVSPVEIDPLAIGVTCGVDQVSDSLADSITSAIYSYLDPTTYPWGTKIKTHEISYYARQVPGVTEINSVTINNDSLDYLLATRWTSPFVDSLAINLMQPDGLTKTYYRGKGAGDLD